MEKFLERRTRPPRHASEVELESLRRELERLRFLASSDRGLLHTLLEHSPHGIIVSDAAGKLVLHNRAAECIWGGSATADTIEAWGAYRAFHPDGRPFDPEDWALVTCLETRAPVEAREVHILRFDDTEAHLLSSCAPLFSPSGEFEGAITVFADITRLRASEAESSRLQADLAAKIRDLESFARRGAALQKVTAALTHALSVDGIAEVVTEHGRELFGATASLLYLREGERLVLVRSAGVSDGRVEPWREIPIDGDGPLSLAVRTGAPVWLGARAELLASFPKVSELSLDGVPLEGLVTLPLGVGGAIIGGLAFSFYQPFLLDAVQRDVFLTVADLCAQVIQRARASDAEREAYRSLQRERQRLAILAQAGETLSAILDPHESAVALARFVVPALADWCVIDELAPDGRLRRLAIEHRDPARVALANDLYQRHPPDPASHRGVYEVLRTGRTEWTGRLSDQMLASMAKSPEHLEILRELRLTSCAIVPLQVRGRTLGALSLLCEGDRRLLEEDIRFVEELGRRAALALDNARLYDAARTHAETLAIVNELGRLISAELDQQKVIQAVTDAVTSLTNARFGAFFYNVLDQRGERYLLYTLSGVSREAFADFPMPRNTAIFGPTFRGEGVVRSDDITLDPRYGRNAPYRGMPEGHLPVRSYLAVPVRSRSGEVLGGLFLAHPEPGVFDQRAEDLAVGLAAQAAVAMDNARLFGEAQRLIRALEQTNSELDQFAYVASHDLKAPLRGIASLAEWLEEDLRPALTDDARAKMAMLRGRARRMEGLIQGILDFTRAGRVGGEREEVDTRKLLLEVSELLGTSPPSRVVPGDGLPILSTGRVALQQVLLNLVGNGLKHAGRPDAEVRVSAREIEEGFEFRVSDNGPGIAPEHRERIWAIFQTLQSRDRFESTGIGLAIVRKIVEARGGRAWIEPNPDQGASFLFTWPQGA